MLFSFKAVPLQDLRFLNGKIGKYTCLNLSVTGSIYKPPESVKSMQNELYDNFFLVISLANK